MFLDVAIGLLLLLGLAGTLVPALPGTALIFAGVLVHAVLSGFDPLGPWRLLAFAALALLAAVLDYVAGALGVKRFGGSGWAVAGALIGAIVGLVFGVVGLLLGPIIGAVAFEWFKSRKLKDSLRSGAGTAVGMVVGTAAKVGLALVMISLYLYWVVAG